MSQSTTKAEETIPSDNDSGSTGSSEAGWNFLLGGLSTETMEVTDWATNEGEVSQKNQASYPDNTMRDEQHDLQANGSNDTIVHRNNIDHHSDVQKQKMQQQYQRMSQRAFCVSANGEIRKPPVRVVDRSSENKGNILVATNHIPKGSVVFTEKALEGIQIPSPSSSTDDLYRVRGCQNCFRSLEPASCITSSAEDLPLKELWPVPEYDDGDPLSSELSQECVKIVDSEEQEQTRSMWLHAKSGRVTCPECGAIFCNRYCAKSHLQAMGDCCTCMRAIQGLVSVILRSETERLFPINDDNDDDDNDDDDDEEEEEEEEEEDDRTSFTNIDPVLILAARMFIAQVRRYRADSSDQFASDFLFDGLCGEAEDIRALGFESPSTLADDTDKAEVISLQPLQHEYDAIANAIGLTEDERNSDWRFSLRQFHKIVAVAQRNSVSLTTGSPFRTYYQAMTRKAGGRFSSRKQQIVSDIARLLGSNDGKLTRDMDRMVEEKCVVKMGGIFTLTALMNHSCDPNAEIRGQEFMDCNLDIVAKEDIHEGEEICISYVNLGPNPSYGASARNRRRKELRSRYLFHCQCSRCIQ